MPETTPAQPSSVSRALDPPRSLVRRLKCGDRLDRAPMMGGWIARTGGKNAG